LNLTVRREWFFAVIGWVGAGLLRLLVGAKSDRRTRPYKFAPIIDRKIGKAIALFVTADKRRLTRMDEKGDRFFKLQFTHSNSNGLQRNLANRYLKAFSSYYRHLGDSCLFLRRISVL